MRIAVLVKEVPDTYGERHLDLETGLVDRAASDAVLDEIGGRALEAAVSHAEANAGTEVVALTVGPESAAEALREALAIGADRAVHVTDPQLGGADLGLTAEVLAAAVERLDADLVLAGNQSTDGLGGVIPAMLAELLGRPQATNLDAIGIGAGEVCGTRASDHGTMVVRASLPAVASITDRLPDPRFPSFKSTSAAKKKPIETLAAADLGVAVEDPAAPRSILISVAARPPRAGGMKIDDEGDGGTRIAEFLAQNRLV
ncbi:MAG: electron transfer flavoprotein subunit beta/FixA family protein [Actinobacteria bacterium]|nr:electron transfer flavoprotein subunit beta/FixA family protein [Actinomycetota bacterium]